MATREIAVGDTVELTVPTGNAPAGARGAITDLLDGGKAIVELTGLPAEPILDRIVIAPLRELRPLSPGRS